MTNPNEQIHQAGTQGYDKNLQSKTEAAQAWQNTSPIPAGVQRSMPASPGMDTRIPALDLNNVFNRGGR
jgi:hypothetical protein